MSSSSSSYIPLSPAALSKIHRIEKSALTPEQEKSTKTKVLTTLLSRDDYLNIFKNLTVLFVGDNSIRTLFRQLCKVLKCNLSLDYSETARQNGKYKPIEDEEILVQKGDIGTDSYQDIHKFHLVANSTKLIYVYLSTILNDSCIQELHYIQDNDPTISTDLIIFCSHTADINEKKIGQANVTFDNYFNNYSIRLEYFLNYLIAFCRQSNKNCCDFYWMSPVPQSGNMSIDEQEQFQKVINVTDQIIKENGFIKFDRYDIWQRRKDLLISATGHFSLHGIREVMDSFARTIGQKYNRSFTLAIPMISLPSSTADPGLSSSYCASSGGSSDICSKSSSSSSSHRYHPYNQHQH